MKNILQVVHVGETGVVKYNYVIDKMNLGYVNESEFNFELLEKREDMLIVRWLGTKTAEIAKNGEPINLHRQGVEFSDDETCYTTLETLGFSWLTQEG